MGLLTNCVLGGISGGLSYIATSPIDKLQMRRGRDWPPFNWRNMNDIRSLWRLFSLLPAIPRLGVQLVLYEKLSEMIPISAAIGGHFISGGLTGILYCMGRLPYDIVGIRLPLKDVLRSVAFAHYPRIAQRCIMFGTFGYLARPDQPHPSRSATATFLHTICCAKGGQVVAAPLRILLGKTARKQLPDMYKSSKSTQSWHQCCAAVIETEGIGAFKPTLRQLVHFETPLAIAIYFTLKNAPGSAPPPRVPAS
eukprot:TRINITY_DN59871_c0_g1_i1.p1 TRINITY_DN59871_c0_g1~~TRINITY_DN59871_c0_g1_i1.p1  ORF type:complete len:273 (-),score=-5.02 TRINITY_DN59871_c0_g1_i1:14-769(-)